MLLIQCPHCGARNSDEFTFSGEIVPRPAADCDPATWRNYLYVKTNATGWQRERWFHVSGCRRFLLIERDQDSNEIRRVSDYGDRR
ncbi:MAG: sarcosine oxidase subunit delta [Acidimicrobiia bacterium]